MAVAAASMRTYLRDVIGIPDSPGADVNARRVAVQNEGLETISDLIEFDEKGIKTLCISVRNPGGTITDPNDAARTISNPGHSIPAIAEKRLKDAVYGAKIYDLISRPLTHEALSRRRLRLFQEHAQIIEDHEDPEQLPVVSKTFGIVKAMDLVPGHFRDRLGVRKIALSYVIRNDPNPPALEAQEANSLTGISFNSLMDELIVHAPHEGNAYTEDNAKVFQILQDMVSGTSFESSVKRYQRRRDGRAAYRALCTHNLGKAKWDKVIEVAETYV